MAIFQTIKFILNHPINSNQKGLAFKRFLYWQIGSRLIPGAVAVPFVNSTELLVTPGMTGATGNIYTGLHEFEDMAFTLHFLRAEDLFVDVGANVGSYTVLAGAAVGARCISFEPLPLAYRRLLRNIYLNDIKGRVQAYNVGIGKEEGCLRFTTGLDTVNHVAIDDEIASGATEEVRVLALDTALGNVVPKMIKIDVEGFETEVIAGADRILSDNNLDAVIIELNGSGKRYGFDEAVVHRKMLSYGFTAVSYSPFDRILMPLDGRNQRSGNTLYVQNLDRVTERITTSPKFEVFNHFI